MTTDFDRRLQDHNSGKAPHTARFKPWEIVVVVEFSKDEKADQFEAYLKSGSGHAFARKRFWESHLSGAKEDRAKGGARCGLEDGAIQLTG